MISVHVRLFVVNTCSVRGRLPATLPNPWFIASHPDVGQPALLPPGQISQPYVFPFVCFLRIFWSAFFPMVAIFAISFSLKGNSISWLALQGLIKKLSQLRNKNRLQRSPPWERKQTRKFARSIRMGKHKVARSGRAAAALDVQHRDDSRWTRDSEESLAIASWRCK